MTNIILRTTMGLSLGVEMRTSRDASISRISVLMNMESVLTRRQTTDFTLDDTGFVLGLLVEMNHSIHTLSLQYSYCVVRH